MDVIFRILLLPSVLASGLQDSNLESLVDAHESGVGMIRSLSMEIEVWQTVEEGKGVDKPLHMRIVWAKDGSRERQRYKFENHKTDSQGRPMNAGDLFVDGKLEKGMHNWDWDDPYPITDGDQGPLSAWIRPQSNRLPTPFPNPAGQFALLEVQPDPSIFARRSLRQFLEAARGQVTVKKGEKPDAWIISIAEPKLSSPHVQLTSGEIELDGNANYLIRRTRFAFSNSASSSETFAAVEREIVEFREFEEGVFVPVRARHTLRLPRQSATPISASEWKASSIVVNSKLPKGALDFAFPENAIVREFPPVNNRVTAHVWGPENQPVREIRSYEDILSRPAPPLGQSPRWANWVGWAILGLVAAALGLAVYRRLRR